MSPRSIVVSLLFICLCLGAAVAPSAVAAQQDPQPPPTNPGEGEPPRPSDYCYRPTPCLCCIYIHLPGFPTIEICVEESWRPECGGDTGGLSAPAPQSIDPTLVVNRALIPAHTLVGSRLDHPTSVGRVAGFKPNFSSTSNGECPAPPQSALDPFLSQPLVQSRTATYGSLASGP